MLSEILEEYKETDDEDQKKKLIREFTDLLWSSKYIFKTYKRYYTYKINNDSLHNRKDLIELFSKYQSVEFPFCKSFYAQRLDSIDYIKIHVNNMYGFLANKNVYLSKEYYKLLLTPKNEYYKTIERLKNGEIVDCLEIEKIINKAFIESEKVKQESANKKINIKWTEYKRLINSYIERLFENYTPLHEYEQKHGWDMNVNIDGWNEDNYVIRYFCRSLTGYLRNYVKSLQPKEIKTKKCKVCKKEIEYANNNKKYCDDCLLIQKREQKRDWARNKIDHSHTKINRLNKGYMGEGKYKSSVNGKHTRQYITWKSMLHRCYSSKYHKREQTYESCEVCDSWLNFQNFAEWYDENYYEIDGEIMCLDKDILVKGNKIYSPETCVFVPKSINSLFIKSNSRRGDLPIGVHFNKKEKKYYATMNRNNKKIHIGIFNNEIDAFRSYKQFKESYIKNVAKKYRNLLPINLFNAMMKYEVDITD